MGEDSGEGDIPLSLILSRQGRENYEVVIFKKGCGIASQAPLRQVFDRKDILLKPFL
jgi:hypothetical protein